MKDCFPLVINLNTEILILGSFPGEISLAKSQYYAHPKNQFWRLLSLVLNEPFTEMAYEEKLKTLLKYKIGLWDVINSCERKGSLDSNIRNQMRNDFSVLKELTPKLKKVCFNGQTAAKHIRTFTEQGLKTLALPSSSPAYTLTFEDKLKTWHLIKK